MGVMDKFLNYMKLNGEEEDDYYDDDYLDDEEDDVAVSPRKSSVNRSKSDDYEEPVAKRPQPAASKITPIKQPSSRRMSNSSGMEVCVIKPTSVEEAREITETLLANRTVVLNLEGLDVDVAQRIIDFTSGSCFAISGNLQKISHYIFIITPSSVDVSGDFQDIFGGSFEMPLNS
ncbi:MAG: cell division protein SepF [Acetatifactor sp.]|nr:cell division protein SepF [Acetatifactor sp.]